MEQLKDRRLGWPGSKLEEVETRAGPGGWASGEKWGTGKGIVL